MCGKGSVPEEWFRLQESDDVLSQEENLQGLWSSNVSKAKSQKSLRRDWFIGYWIQFILISCTV